MQTIYYTKTFTSGLLKGISVTEKVTKSDVSFWRIGRTGEDYGTRARWVITDASFQNYAR